MRWQSVEARVVLPEPGGPNIMIRILFQFLVALLIIYIKLNYTAKMRALQLLMKWSTSTRKFYEIAKAQQDKILPSAPEETIISKHLKQLGQPTHLSNKLHTKNKQSKEKDYIDFLQMNPQGSLLQRQHKNVHLTMLSVNYNINLSQIYQLFSKCNPDLIFMQTRPQNYIDSFSLLPNDGSNFSDRKYLEQLILSKYDIENNILDQDVMGKLRDIADKGTQSQRQRPRVYIKDNKNIIGDEVVLMGLFYAAKKNKQIMLAEIPQQPWRQWICNSNTLMELQEIFKNITKNMPFYQSYHFTPYQLATIINPKFFLTLNDNYMSTLLEMAIASNRYKKILCVSGLMENYAMEKILSEQRVLRRTKQGQQFIPIIQYLIGPEIKQSLLRNLEGWEIIEKHIIMDVLIHGEAVTTIGLDHFKHSNRMIEVYGRRVYGYDQQTIMRFRFEKTLFYLDVMKRQIREGQELKKKIILREAIREADSS